MEPSESPSPQASEPSNHEQQEMSRQAEALLRMLKSSQSPAAALPLLEALKSYVTQGWRMEGDGLGYSTLMIELMEKDMDGKASSLLKHLMGGLVVLRPDCRKTILSSLHTRLTGSAPLARPEALQEVHLKLMTLCTAGCAAFPPVPVGNSDSGLPCGGSCSSLLHARSSRISRAFRRSPASTICTSRPTSPGPASFCQPSSSTWRPYRRTDCWPSFRPYTTRGSCSRLAQVGRGSQHLVAI